MPSHMSVQNYATRRNKEAEVLASFILAEFGRQIYERGFTVEAPLIQPQKQFTRDDCQDVFDHFAEIKLARPVGGHSGTLHIWAQTTCYKGNSEGHPEANKSYEIRETLIEALGLRRWLISDGIFFRTIHMTFGPASYSYGWIKTAKDKAFDLSLYPVTNNKEMILFKELAAALKERLLRRIAVGG
jgi:hypothetical protein